MRAVLLLVVSVGARGTAHVQPVFEGMLGGMMGGADLAVVVPEAGRVIHQTSSTATLRRIQAVDSCAGCSCVAEHTNVCAATVACAATGACNSTTAQSACASEGGDGRCVFNNQSTGPACHTSNTTITPESTCSAQSAHGVSACTGAGSCVYDDGTSDDVCESADLAECTAQSSNGETACKGAGACTFIVNEDYRITRRTDGSEWNADLATKLATAIATHPSGLPMVLSSTCNDAMASNNGVAAPCTYVCSDLEQAYFQGTTQTVQCFVYDLVTGWPADLLSRIQTTKRWDPYNMSSTMMVADNTIYVPADESWIIQGVCATGALPPVFPARLASGSRDEISHANLVLRSFRITGQTAPLDSKNSWYTFSNTNIAADPSMRLGGAVSYEGHGSRLLFERMIFDHNVGTSGGGIFIYGHFQRNPNLLMTQIDMVDCLFWANQARWIGGDMRLVDIWPLQWTMDGCYFLDSWAFLAKTVSLSEYANEMDAGRSGGPILGPSAAPTLTGSSHVIFRNSLQDGKNSNSNNAMLPGWRGVCTDLTAWATSGWQRVAIGAATPIMHVLHENVVSRNYENVYYGGSSTHNYMQGAAGMQFNVTSVHCDHLDNKIHSTASKHSQGGITAFGDWLAVANSRFERGGFVNDAQTGGEGGAIAVEGHHTTTIRHSSFVKNWAALGGAVVIVGSASAEIQSCTFVDNKASRSGGAIESKASGTLSIQDSVFSRNVVYTLTPPPQDKTVRLYTGSSGPENPGTHAGGEAMFTCEWFVVPACDPCLAADVPSAVDGSIDHMVGVISSAIPGDGVYHAYRTYSHQLALRPGNYRLYHGSKVNTQDIVKTWRGGGWIDMVGVVDRVYVQFDDNRASARQVGCYQGADVSPITAASCPLGQKFWSMTNFSIGFGNGGALSMAGTRGVTIQNATFTKNRAGNGASAYGVTIASMDLVGTTLDAVAEPLQLFAVQLESCETRACSPGNRCSVVKSSRFCHGCGINEIGDGRLCTACPPGTGPNDDHSVCLDCSMGESSALGLCDQCGPGSHASGTGQAVCLPCPDKTRPNADSTRCQCSIGSYNGTAGVHVCFVRGFDEDHFNDAMATHESAARGSASDCRDCPQDQGGDECLRCMDGLSMVAPGYTIPKLPQESSRRALQQQQPFTSFDTVSVFRCHEDIKIGAKRCPGTTTQGSGPNHRCAMGYTGYICGECIDNWGMNDGECTPCEDTGYTWKSFGITMGTVAVVAVLFCCLGRLWGPFKWKHVVRCAAQPLRILITYSQVLAQLGDVLDFQYPGLFGDVVDMLRPLMDIFGLLFRALGPSECFGVTGFTSRWVLRTLGLPGLFALVILIILAVSSCFGDSTRARQSAKGQAFFAVFFCFPSICVINFAAFLCRPLTPSASILEVDDAVLCEDSSHRVMQGISIGVILVFALGVPVSLFTVLYSKAHSYEKETRKTYTKTARRLSKELDVDLSRAEFVIRDCVIGGNFSFVMDAYDPRFLYWEALDMLRKLALVGLVLLAGRGSFAQLYAAIFLSFIFFALQMKSWPYKVHSDNVFRAVTELHIFVAILTALMLKHDLKTEALDEVVYDLILFLSFIALVPVAFVITVFTKVRHMGHAVTDGLSINDVDAAEQRRRAFELLVLGLGTASDREIIRRFVDGWMIEKEFAGFLSHYKQEAAAEARILKLELCKALRTNNDTIFLDADNLSDLRQLQTSVTNSDTFILMLTDGVFSRPWCLAELEAAATCGIPILVLRINNSFGCSMERMTEALGDLPGYLARTNPNAVETLKQLLLDPNTIGPKILSAITKEDQQHTKAALTFDPHQSSVMLQSQIAALATAMVHASGIHTNESLLPDLAPTEPKPWTVVRKYAVYIVSEANNAVVAEHAAAVKVWLITHTAIAPQQIRLCSDDDTGRNIDDSAAQDCDSICQDVDTVILLQTAAVLREPRCLARLYAASRFRVPIVSIILESSKPDLQSLLYNFEYAKATLERLHVPSMLGKKRELTQQGADSIETATGATIKQVGDELLRSIPNVISKPLQIDGAATEFAGQMLDVELTLHRLAQQRTTQSTSKEVVPQARAKAPPARAGTPTRRRANPKARQPEGRPARAVTPPLRAQVEATSQP